jgi:hypothetical protein
MVTRIMPSSVNPCAKCQSAPRATSRILPPRGVGLFVHSDMPHTRLDSTLTGNVVAMRRTNRVSRTDPPQGHRLIGRGGARPAPGRTPAVRIGESVGTNPGTRATSCPRKARARPPGALARPIDRRRLAATHRRHPFYARARWAPSPIPARGLNCRAVIGRRESAGAVHPHLARTVVQLAHEPRETVSSAATTVASEANVDDLGRT